MPVYTDLWALNNKGRPYILSTDENKWKKNDSQLDLKKLSTSTRFTWAIGGDHQIYLYVVYSDVPVRVKVEAYENQRWNPYEGFTDRLLPSDRPVWSDADGIKSRYKDEICLPNTSWQWESPWYLENSIDGQPLGKEGWTYAVDFPRIYSKSKKWNSCVRRRKWLRYRMFMGMNSWTMIPGINDDATAEPFIDIVIGGNEIPGGDAERYCVWGVTVLGKVYFRNNVSINCPEGSSWIHVPSPDDCEINQISVGLTGLVWAVKWNGEAIVRLGVSRHNIMGTGWTTISSDCKLDIVSVGSNCVWAVCRQHKVWFRTGIVGSRAYECENSAKGTAWVEMVGLMSMIAVGLNDQVFAIGFQDRCLYFRTGITFNEPNGRTWKQITASVDNLLAHDSDCCSITSGHHSERSILSDLSHSSTITKPQSSHVKPSHEDFQSNSSEKENKKQRGFSVSAKFDSARKVSSTDDPAVTSRRHSEYHENLPSVDKVDRGYLNVLMEHDLSDDAIQTVLCDKFKINNTLKEDLEPNSLNSEVSDTVIDFVNDVPRDLNVLAECNTIEYGDHIDVQEIGLQEESINEPWMAQLEERFRYAYDDDDNLSWCWVCLRACSLNPHNLPNWFSSGSLLSKIDINQPWRIEIMTHLGKRYNEEMRDYVGSYEQAVEKAKWIKSGKCKVLAEGRSNQWADGTIELERQGNEGIDRLDKGVLTCSYHAQHRVFPRLNMQTKFSVSDLQAESIVWVPGKIELSLQDITCIVSTFLPSHSGLTIYTAKRVSKQKPLKLSFRSTLEMEDWMTSIYVACYDLRKVNKQAHKNSAFALSANGEIYTHVTMADMETSPCNQMFWKLLGGGHLAIVESSYSGVVWGIGYDNTVWVYTGGYGGGLFKGISGCSNSVNAMHDNMRVYVYENQRWNPLTGFSTKSLPTDRYQWSDQSGLFECTKETTQLPSTHWSWSTDWCIDYKASGGVDNNGWQYAYDFPRTYHSKKSFTDYVRRRRWFRKCKLSTSGPWKVVGSTPLTAISVQVDHDGNDDNPVAVWAIATNGDALSRTGVSPSNPSGLTWNHVPADQPFQSLSVGGEFKVWAIARDGSAFLRHGISEENITGNVWFHVEPPAGGAPLRFVSCGKNSVMAVDVNKRLWFRQEIMPHFPEGTSWRLVSENIQQVSVGALDQVWAIVDSIEIANKTVNGVICRRTGISEDNPIGTGWDYGIGGGWQNISIRSCRPDLEAPKQYLDDMKPSFKLNSKNQAPITPNMIC